MNKVLLGFIIMISAFFCNAADSFLFVKNTDIIYNLEVNTKSDDPSLEIKSTPEVVPPGNTALIKITSDKPGAAFKVELKTPNLEEILKMEIQKDYFGKMGFVYLDDYTDHIFGDIKENTIYSNASIKV